MFVIILVSLANFLNIERVNIIECVTKPTKYFLLAFTFGTFRVTDENKVFKTDRSFFTGTDLNNTKVMPFELEKRIEKDG